MSEIISLKQAREIEQARKHFMNGAAAFTKRRTVDLLEVIKTPNDVTIKLTFDEASQPIIREGAIGKLIRTIYKKDRELGSIEISWVLNVDLKGQCVHNNLIELGLAVPDESDPSQQWIPIPGKYFHKERCLRINTEATPFTYAVKERDIFSVLKLRRTPKFTPRVLRPSVVKDLGNILGGLEGEFTTQTKLRQSLQRLFPDKFANPRLPYGELIIGGQ